MCDAKLDQDGIDGNKKMTVIPIKESQRAKPPYLRTNFLQAPLTGFPGKVAVKGRSLGK